MAVRREFLDLLRGQERDLDALFDDLVERIDATLARYDDSNGRIPLSRQRELREAISHVLFSAILNVTQGNFSAWRVLPDGSIIPTSPYFRILWENMTASMRLAIKEQSDIMTTRMAELLTFRLRQAFLDPYVMLNRLPAAEAAGLRRYRHPLLARRSDGRQLQQRLVSATNDMIRRTTGSIDGWIAGNFSTAQMVVMLQQHFRGRLTLEGSIRGGMELRRIARSEPLFAFSSAAVAAASTNPYIGVVYIERGRPEPCPVCDPVVRDSPYALEEAPLPGYHPHCFCKMRFEVLSTPRWDTDDPNWRQAYGALSPRFYELLVQQRRERGE